MVMTLVGFDVQAGGASGDVTLTIPVSATVGQLVFSELYLEGNGGGPTVTPPSGEGYTLINSRYTNTGSNPDMHAEFYYKRVESGDPGTDHSWAVSANWRGGGLAVFSNPTAAGDPNNATPVPSTSTAASASHIAPDITPASQPHMEVVGDLCFGSGTFSNATLTEIFDAANVYMGYLYRTSVAAPGARTITGPNDRFKAVHFLFTEGVPTKGPTSRIRRTRVHSPLRMMR